MTLQHPIVFLLDVDNTLLDNDAFERDLRSYLRQELGAERQARYQEILDELRAELGYVDYLGALQRLRVENLRDLRLLEISSFLLDYPFAERLYPSALDVIARLRRHGSAVILSDGDAVFQPRKIKRSDLEKAVDGHVLIYVHNGEMLDDVEQRFPAEHYILIDDKLGILTTVKNVWGSRVTTMFPRQGHYAHDPKNRERYPPADITIGHFSDLLRRDLPATAAVDTSEALKSARLSRKSSV